MLMNPTLTNNFHPTYPGLGQEGIRHDLNRLYYNAEYFRNDMLDAPGMVPGYPMGAYGIAPYYPTTHTAQGVYPWGALPQFAGSYPYAYGASNGMPGAYGFRTWEPRFDARFAEPRFDARFADPRMDPRYFDPRLGYARQFEIGTRPFEGAVRPFEPGVRTLDPMSAQMATEAGATYQPATNWAEAPDAYLLVVELPGIDLKDITLQILGTSLVLNAYRRPTWSNGTVTVNYHFTEGRFGTLRRALPLPTGVLPGQIQANYVNGLLTILIPKSAQSANQVPQASIVINSAVPTTM